jgi:hypothetical protein
MAITVARIAGLTGPGRCSERCPAAVCCTPAEPERTDIKRMSINGVASCHPGNQPSKGCTGLCRRQDAGHAGRAAGFVIRDRLACTEPGHRRDTDEKAVAG